MYKCSDVFTCYCDRHSCTVRLWILSMNFAVPPVQLKLRMLQSRVDSIIYTHTVLVNQLKRVNSCPWTILHHYSSFYKHLCYYFLVLLMHKLIEKVVTIHMHITSKGFVPVCCNSQKKAEWDVCLFICSQLRIRRAVWKSQSETLVQTKYCIYDVCMIFYEERKKNNPVLMHYETIESLNRNYSFISFNIPQ